MLTSIQETFTNSDIASTKPLMDDYGDQEPSSTGGKKTSCSNESECRAEDEEEEEEEAKWKKITKAIAPHFVLYFIAVVYSLIGAAVFIHLEEPYSRQQQTDRLNQIRKNREEFVTKLWNLTSERRPMEEGEAEFQKFAIKMHSLHKSSKFRMDTTATMDEWNFNSAVFFVITTLSTIGYGNVAPETRGGRVFCICYCIIGIPLLIITTADVAKFMSSGVNRFYINYLKIKEKILAKLKKLCCRQKPGEVNLQDTEGVAEYLWNNIDSIHYVQVHATLILAIVVAYASLGGMILGWYEQWSFFEGFYFSMTSVLKVGFGDMLPSNQLYFWLSLLYIFFGLTIATMCVDVVGVQYVRQIHEIGKVAKNADYLNVIQKAKYRRRRREAMRSLMGLLTMLNKIQFPSGTASLSKKEKDILDDFCENQEPPVPPTDVRVTTITPYSMKLSWTPPTSPGKTTRYVLSYKMKHSRSESTVNIANISDGEYEIKSLKSFSIYEISLAAVNRVGCSDSVRLIQITEPESAPQDLTVELLDANTVRLRWKPPYKKRKDVKKYAVYYSKNLDDAFEKWYKVCVDAAEQSLTLEELSEAEQYAFCISSVYDRGHSPISRSVYPSNVDISHRATRSSSQASSGLTDNSQTTTAPPITSIVMDVPL